MVFANYTRRSTCFMEKENFPIDIVCTHIPCVINFKSGGYIPVWFVGWKNTEIWIKPWLMGIIGSTKLVRTPLMFALVAMG
jgi:hypothetical protein